MESKKVEILTGEVTDSERIDSGSKPES